MRAKLIEAIKKSKMNYLLKVDEGHIYPFIYDILTIRFSLLIKMALYHEQLNKTHLLAKEINDTKYRFNEKDSNENYLFEEFVRLAEELPEEYINKDYTDEKYIKTQFDEFSKYPTRFLVKHYSQILDIPYKDVAIVVSRLLFDTGTYNTKYFYLSKDILHKRLTIDNDYFRSLSLNII